MPCNTSLREERGNLTMGAPINRLQRYVGLQPTPLAITFLFYRNSRTKAFLLAKALKIASESNPQMAKPTKSGHTVS